MLSTRPIVAGSVPVSSPALSFPSFMVTNLKEKGITDLFPAQAEVVPFLMREGYNHDVCVMSPTGTGKTLAYAIPIVKRLHRRIIPRIRGLVLLPSHDLALQVKSVFDYLVANAELKVCVVGARKLRQEQEDVADADIIIATPERLQSHIDATENFTLEHLEFLILDEADKLLSSYAPWLTTIFPSIYNTKQGFLNVPLNGNVTPNQINIATVRVSHVHPKAFENSPPLRRWLFSATLTSHSTQIAQMHLHCPMFFTAVSDAMMKYQFPKTLLQFYMCAPASMRAIAVSSLITDLHAQKSNAKIVCFASSVDACHRLCILLRKMLPQLAVLEFFGSLGDEARANVLQKFQKGSTNVVVSSDLLARGLDIANIDAIINYDVPAHIKSYVHRVGRTARGGNTGVAYSFVEPEEKDTFLQMVRKGENLNIEEMPFDEDSYSAELIARFKGNISKLLSTLTHEAKSGKRTKFQ